MPFEHVDRRPTKTAMYIAEQIADIVRKGELTFGDTLPPERDLAERFGVSRQPVREALTALQLAGLVDTRAGLGTFVGRGFSEQSRNPLHSLTWSLHEEEAVGEVLEARLIVEPEAAYLAAHRLTPEARGRLEALLDRMKAAQTEHRRFGALDLQFHLEIAESSGNRVITKMVQAMVGYANQRLWRGVRERSYKQHPGLARTYLRHHRSMLEALLRHDAVGARKAMVQHLKEAQVTWLRDAQRAAAAEVRSAAPHAKPHRAAAPRRRLASKR